MNHQAIIREEQSVTKQNSSEIAIKHEKNLSYRPCYLRLRGQMRLKSRAAY